MAGASWLVDKSRIATKIKSASGACDPNEVIWKTNPTRICPNCHHPIDNSDKIAYYQFKRWFKGPVLLDIHVTQEWPGLPKGVKFDPSDQEIIWHLLVKAGVGNLKPHPFIDEFITTLEVDDGICYTHPQHLPGVKQDGRASHFFHRAIKAYNTGTRKRRKVHGQDDVRWHKTGRTKLITLNGVQKGCKKIMVLYTNAVRGGKSEKTNWVMHQYHLGTEEDEKEGEYVISKVFYKEDQDIPEAAESKNATVAKVDPVTPKSTTPEPPRNERQDSDLGLDLDLGQEALAFPEMDCLDEIQADCEESAKANPPVLETQENEGMDNKETNAYEGQLWWDSDSQNLLDSQQLVEALTLCEDIFHSQSSNKDDENDKNQTGLSVYAHLGPEHLKKDIEECQKLAPAGPEHQKDIEDGQNLDIDLANIERDTPPEHRLSQLEFGSQDSYTYWGFQGVN
ncbi:SUPPRESSOR OF GAMMA RESPONSE 1 isoform X1 [Arachis hypogaea]